MEREAMFNEENTVEQQVLDTLCDGVTSNMVADEVLYSLRRMRSHRLPS